MPNLMSSLLFAAAVALASVSPLARPAEPAGRLVSSLAEVDGAIDSAEGRALYQQEMDGAAPPDGFGVRLPEGVAAEQVVHVLLPDADAALATRVGLKPMPRVAHTSIAIVCLAPSETARAQALRHDRGQGSCDPWSQGQARIALGVVEVDPATRQLRRLASLDWSGPDNSPLRVTWEHSQLFGPLGINHWDDAESVVAKGESWAPDHLHRFDLAPFEVADGVMAFGLRSGLQEGYSGGGASFQVLTLFAVLDGTLRPLLSQPIYHFKDIAGNWNADGTRQHELFEGENVLVVLPRVRDGFHDLRIKAKKGRWRQDFRWDAKAQRYRAATERGH